MKTKIIFPLWVSSLFVVMQIQVFAQPETSLFANWNEEDKAAIEALVLYPQETRMAILKASQCPELLIKIESMQALTSSSFQDLIAPLSQEEQTLIYDLSRYPGMISRLALAAEVGEKNINDILRDYPDIIHSRAKEAYSKYGALLQEVDQLNKMADLQFRELLGTYPDPVQEALEMLVDLPEVLNLLTENIRMTILIGDLYQKDPAKLHRQLDSLNLVVAEANTQELENWQKSVESDPEVMAELKGASEEFAEEYGYDDDYYDYDDMYYGGEDERYVVESYYYYNYPYWFGYPSWYFYPRWRPYPLWYEAGFYIVLDGGFVVYRLPSFYFTYWYFHRPYHHYYYPYLSRQFVRHTYYGPRPGTSSIYASVRSWQKRNREVITDDWLRNGQASVEQFREYGKFEMDLEKYNRKKPENALSQREYLERNRNKYPRLTRTASRHIIRSDQPGAVPRPRTEPAAPARKPNETIITPRRTEKPAVERDRTRTIPNTRQVDPSKTVPKVNRGVENHRATIERSRTRTVQPKVIPRAAPRTAPKPAPRSAPKTAPKTQKKRTKKNG